MWNALVTIPLQIVCQLVVQENNGTGHTPFVVDTQSLEASDTVLPNYVSRTSEPSNLLPKGYTAIPDIGVAYKYYTDEMTWNSARKFCMGEGGNLAVLDTFQKIKYALKIKSENNKYGLFVGIHRLFDNSEWTDLKTEAISVRLPCIHLADASVHLKNELRIFSQTTEPIGMKLWGRMLYVGTYRPSMQLSMIPWGSVSNDETLDYRCMVMYFDGRGLTADDCTTEYRFICEIPLPVD